MTYHVLVEIGPYRVDALQVDDKHLCSLFTHLSTVLANKPIGTALAETALNLGIQGLEVLWATKPTQTHPE